MIYRLAANGEKADGHQKQTSVRNCKYRNQILMLTTTIPDDVMYLYRTLYGVRSAFRAKAAWLLVFWC